MTVKGVVAALEDGELAVQGFELRSDQIVDVVDPVQKAQAAVAGVRPLGIQVEQCGGDLGATVGMDGAVAFVQGSAKSYQGRVLAQIFDAEMATDGAGEFRRGHLLHEGVDRGAAIGRVVGEEARAGVVWEVTLQVAARFVRQLAMRNHEREGLFPYVGVRAIESDGIEQDSGVHEIS